MRYVLSLLCLLVPLLAEAQSATVTLLWEYNLPATGQDAFNVYRKTGQTGTYGAKLASVGPTLRTYADVSATIGQVLCYVVRAAQGTAESPNSNEICTAVLIAPVNLRVQ